MRIFSKSKLVGIDGRPMGLTGQDMKRPGGGIATREQQGVAGAFERKGTVWKAAKPQSVGKQQLVLRLHDYTRVAKPRIGQLQTIENIDI